MGEFILNVKATGTEAFAADAKKAADAMDKEEQTAKRLARWQNELATLARKRREATEKQLPAEQQLERLLQKRAQLEERIARAGNNQLRSTALRLQQARLEGRIRALQAQQNGGGLSDLLNEIPGFARLSRIGSILGNIGNKLLPVVGGVVGAVGLGNLTRSGVNSAQTITELSDATQTSRKDIQSLTFGASATNTPADVVLNTRKTLAKAQGEILAGIGGQENLKAFETFGITLKDLQKQDPTEIFKQLTSEIGKGQLSAEKYAAGIKLMGEGFPALIQAAKKGLSDHVQEFEKSNRVIREGTLTLLTGLGNAWDAFWAKTTSNLKKVAVEIAGGLVSVGNLVAGSIANIITPGAGDSFLDRRAKYIVDDDGGRLTEQLEAELESAKAKRTEREKIAALAKQIETAAGADAEEVLEGLAGKTSHEYEAALKKLQRAKAKEQAQQAQRDLKDARGMVPSFDALHRIGIIRGEGQNFQRPVQEISKKLENIHSELKSLNQEVRRNQ